jgi:hypothetical protein
MRIKAQVCVCVRARVCVIHDHRLSFHGALGTQTYPLSPPPHPPFLPPPNRRTVRASCP